MAGEPDNLVLVMLRRLDAKIDGIAEVQKDHSAQLAWIRDELINIRRDRVHDMETDAAIQKQVDRLRADVERLKRRLDITD